MNPICVSVIIPAYNAANTIGQTLEALSRQKCFQPFEVIVVDDGSSDNTAGMVCLFSAVKYVRQENAGPASARNHGAKLARGEYLAFTDSDCIPHEDWISLLMAGFTPWQPPGLPRLATPGVATVGVATVGVVAGSYGIANPHSVLAQGVYTEILWRHTYLMPDFPNSFGSYNFCVRKNIFDAVGGFDTGYRSASGEDNDLSYKITAAGWRIYFQRKALVDHFHPTRVVKYLKEQFRHGFWRVKMYRDHPRMMKGDGYTYWKDIMEMPYVLLSLGAAVLSAFHYLRWIDLECFILLPMLLFEITCAVVMSKCFFEGIYFGFIIFFRAYARMFGFSAGIVSFLCKKFKKIF